MNNTNTRAQFGRLWRVLAGVGRLAASGPAARKSLPALGRLPPPWLTWTLIGLVRHRRRQLWVGEVVRERLSGDLGLIATAGALGHPKRRPQSGPVPGLPEWEYYFHGRGCCLTHRVRGERIDVDFFGDDAESFDFWFYKVYLQSLREPEPPERRLIELHPSLETVQLAIETLRRAGLLVRGGSERACRLAGAVLRREDAVAAFCAAWAEPQRRAVLAAHIGDWPAAQDHLPADAAPDLRALCAVNAQAVRAMHQDAMRRLSESGGAEAGLAVLALSEADPEWIPRGLRGPPSATSCAILDLLGRRPDAARWCEEVCALVCRLQSEEPPPHPGLWAEGIAFLLRQGYRASEVASWLPRAGGYAVGEAALLALEYAPEYALGLLRRALRSKGVPANRLTAAAILALIDRPGSRAELLAVLRESDDQEATSECRAALDESREPAARRAVEEWQERNPHEPEPGPTISMREWMLQNRSKWLRFEMDRLRERVARLSLPEFLQA